MIYIKNILELSPYCLIGCGGALILSNWVREVANAPEREARLKQLALGIGVLATGILFQMYSQLPPEPLVYTTLCRIVSTTALIAGACGYCFDNTAAERKFALKIMAVGLAAMMMELGLALSGEAGLFVQKCSLDELKAALKVGGGDHTYISKMFKTVNETFPIHLNRLFRSLNDTYITCENFVPVKDNYSFWKVEIPLEKMKESVMWGLHPISSRPFIAIKNTCDRLANQITCLLQARSRDGNVIVNCGQWITSKCDITKGNSEDFFNRFVQLIQTGATLTSFGANITLV